jgi:hypothetical protein
MEKVSDILKTIKERISNPLIFSFIISWLLFNWEISIGLFWLSEEELKREGYKSLLDYINCKGANFGWPIFTALLYTIGGPLIKILVTAFHTLTSKWSDNWSLKLSEGSNVPLEKFLSLKENMTKRTKVLEEHLKDARNSLEEFEKTHTKLLTEETKNVTLEETNKSLNFRNELLNTIRKNTFNVDYLEGLWSVHRSSVLEDVIIENYRIEKGNIFKIDGNNMALKFTIKHFYFDSENKKIFFVKYSIPELLSIKTEDDLRRLSVEYDPSKVNLFINDLTIEVENERYVGFENQLTQISYIKL